VVSGKSFSFDGGLVHELEIEPIDNDVRGPDKMVNIVLNASDDTPVGMAGGANSTFALTIQDNEHPLAQWIGTYNVFADSYGDVISGEPEGAWDEEWTVTSSPVEGNESQLELVGMAFGELPVIATIDMEAMTITLPALADCGTGYEYPQTLIYRGNYETTEEADVIGTLGEDGSMAIDLLTMVIITDDGGAYVWDAFNTTWTKGAGKAAPDGPGMIKVSR
jgi:hypothetical protein